MLRTPDPADGRAWLVLRTEAGDRVSDAADRAMARGRADARRTMWRAVRYAEFLTVLKTIGTNPGTA